MQTWHSAWMQAKTHHEDLLDRGAKGRLTRAATKSRKMRWHAWRIHLGSWTTGLLGSGSRHRTRAASHHGGWETPARSPSPDETCP